MLVLTKHESSCSRRSWDFHDRLSSEGILDRVFPIERKTASVQNNFHQKVPGSALKILSATRSWKSLLLSVSPKNGVSICKSREVQTKTGGLATAAASKTVNKINTSQTPDILTIIFLQTMKYKKFKARGKRKIQTRDKTNERISLHSEQGIDDIHTCV